MTSASNSDKLCLPAVNIVRILPGIPLSQVFARKRCYLGISMDNPLFAGDSLRALLLWAGEHFEHCLIVVGDYLSRFNEQIWAGCDEAEAGRRALECGDSFLQREGETFECLAKDHFELTRWKEHIQGIEFSVARDRLNDLFESNASFRAAIEHDAAGFVQRQERHKTLRIDMKQAIRLSCEYILEETAVFSALAQRGHTVELYPGCEIRVLAEVAQGRYPDVPVGLKSRINVELKVAKRK